MNLDLEIQRLRSDLSRQKQYSEKWYGINNLLASKVRKWRETNTLRSVS